MNVMMFAHGGSQNRGCEAIVRSTANILKDKNRNLRVYLASDLPETDRDIPLLDEIYNGAATPLEKFSKEWIISSARYKLFRDESYALRKIHKNILKHIDKADICLSIGGDNYCYGEQPGWYEIDKEIKRKGKKLVLWCCSIGEEDMTENKAEDLKRFDLILARETITFNMLIKQGFNNVKLCADPAFLLEKEELPLPYGWNEGNTVGLNFSPLVNRKNKKTESYMESLIRYILENTNLTIALTPHVIQQGNNDYELLKVFLNKFKSTERVILLPDHLNAVQLKGYISRMRFFIGARTHATIAAYSSFVPCMVLGYSVKSKGIARDLFGEEKFVLDIKELSAKEKLIDSFKLMYEQEQNIIGELKNTVPHIKEMSYKAVEYINMLK